MENVVSDAPNLPTGTFEYIDENKKRNWKKIIEISLLGVIAAVPLVLSLFKIDYSVQRAYEVVNPAYIGTSSTYEGWSGFISAAKNIILPATKTEDKESTTIEQISITPTTTSTTDSSEQSQMTEQNGSTGASQAQTNYSTQSEEQSASPTVIQQQEQAQEYIYYPKPSSYEEPSSTVTPSVTPAIAACTGKKNGDNCSFIYSGYTINGRCKSFNGHLICVQQ